MGQRRAFLVGMTGFAAASVLTAASDNLLMLVGGRALQGLAGALLIPAALALLPVAVSGSP